MTDYKGTIMKSKIKYLAFGDQHLGHTRNSTEDKINALNEFFKVNEKEFKDVDIIISHGDEFDRIINNGTDEFKLIFTWFLNLVKFCHTHKIKLRFVEGTSSHSFKQLEILSVMINLLNFDVDLKYFDALTIEYMEDLDLSILYVPDELNHKAKDTFVEIKALLKEHNLTQVDIAAVHGAFHFQLPMVYLESSHTEEDFLSVVKHYITVGHIHTPMIYERIIGQGSVDRDKHGEEEAKGAMLLELDRTGMGKDKFTFIENKKAKIFKKLTINQTEYDKVVNYLDKNILKYPKDSYFMLNMPFDSPILAYYDDIRINYKNYNFKINKLGLEEYTAKLGDSIIKTKELKVVSITKDNIKSLIDEEIKITKLDNNELQILNEELKELL